MALTDFLPTREAELLTWAQNFVAKTATAPEAVGLSAAQVLAVSNLTSNFQTAYQKAVARATRSPMNVELKNAAKTALVAEARRLSAVVQSFPPTTDAQRINLGLNVRAQRRPIPAPNAAPLVEVVGVSGHTVSLRLRDAASTDRRGRPPQTAGCSLFVYVGNAAPAEFGQYVFQLSTSLTTVDLPLSPTLPPGQKVWITGFWYNSRAASGPAASPVGTFVQGGGVAKQAA